MVLVAWAAVGPAPARAGERLPLRFTTVLAADTPAETAAFELFAARLGERLGQPVTFVAAPSYTAVIEQLGGGKVDMALVGAVSYLRARHRGEVRAILRTVRFGQYDYYGQIVVREGSAVGSLQELRGKRIAFVDESSTSGWLYPRRLLARAGLDPDRDVTGVVVGSHGEVVRQVVAGRVDAGACFRGAEASLPDPGAVVPIAQTPRIPGDPMVVRAGLGAELVTRIRDALVGLAADPAARSFFTDAQIDAFAPAVDGDYDDVARLVTTR